MNPDQNSPLSGNGQPLPDRSPEEDTFGSATIDDRATAESLEPDAIKLLFRQLRELGEYCSYYAAARTDNVKLSLRNAVGWVVAAALGFLAVGGLLVMAGWLLLIGVAQGLSVLFGDRLWVGNLLTGALLLAGLGGGLYGVVIAHSSSTRERTVEKYGKRQARQKARYGRNVSERAGGARLHRKRAQVSGRSGRQRQNGDHADPAEYETNRDEGS